MVQEASEHRPAAPTAVRPAGVLMEVDNLAYSSRRIYWMALQELLSERGLSLTRVHYARYSLEWPPALYLDGLLKAVGNVRLRRDWVLKRLEEKRDQSLADSSPAWNRAFIRLTELCRRQRVPVGWLSFFGDDVARRVASACGLKEGDFTLHTMQPTRPILKPSDTWVPLATKMGVPPARCLAITTSRLLCLAAVAGGMRCVVCPDEFTAFDDFPGHDELLETWDDRAVDRLAQLIGAGQ